MWPYYPFILTNVMWFLDINLCTRLALHVY